MRVAVLGAGPAGLQFSLVAQRRFPAWGGEVFEQNPADATFGFGVVFSDDIGMAAAFSAGGVKARVDAHLDAGCDVYMSKPINIRELWARVEAYVESPG